MEGACFVCGTEIEDLEDDRTCTHCGTDNSVLVVQEAYDLLGSLYSEGIFKINEVIDGDVDHSVMEN